MLDAAYRTQKVLRLTSYPAAFNSRNKNHKNVVTTLGAPGGQRAYTRSDLKKRIERGLAQGRQADIAIFDLTNKDYMLRHAKGGNKTAIDGTNIAIPSYSLMNKRGTRGMRESWKPKQILASKGGRGKAGFINKVNGTPMIMRRTTKERYPLEVMYVLASTVRIPKTFKFYDDARIYNRLFDAAFKREYNFRINNVISRKYSR